MPHAIFALWKREIIKFLRDRNRVVGALAQPLGFWLLLGLGFQGTFTLADEAGSSVSYMAFLFPGVIAMIVLFTALFSTISIVEERKTGFLQAALVAPISRRSFVLGTMLGGTTLALAQALLFLLLLPFIDLELSMVGLLLLVGACVLTGLALTGVGVLLAWRMETTRGFHAVMNLVLLPMWLLSGAVFPLTTTPIPLRWLMLANPVTYCVAALRQAFYWPATTPDLLFSPTLAWLIALLFPVVVLLLAARTVSRPLYG